MDTSLPIKNATIRFINAKDNYYNQFIFYFQFLDNSHQQLKHSYLFYKNPIFRNDKMEHFIGVIDIVPDVKFIPNGIYNCDIELFEGHSPNPRIRSKYYYGRILNAEELID